MIQFYNFESKGGSNESPLYDYRGIILRVLGERLNGIQEVSGSIPLISTKSLETN